MMAVTNHSLVAQNAHKSSNGRFFLIKKKNDKHHKITSNLAFLYLSCKFLTCSLFIPEEEKGSDAVLKIGGCSIG